MLQRSIFNPVGNSLEALESHATPEPTIHVDVFSELKGEKRWIVVQIEDNGPDFSDDVLLQLDAPIQTTKPHGMGLGLMLTQSMVRMWDGHTIIQNHTSAQGSGARIQLRLKLTQHGFELRTHESAEALLAADVPQTPRLLILDVRMPGMSGLELHNRLQAQGLNLPVIFMSGECQPHETTAAQSSTAVDFLWKPFSTQQLLQAIERGLHMLATAET